MDATMTKENSKEG